MKIQEKKALAKEISTKTKWDGSDILDILQIALEDANFHSVNSKIELMRANESLISNEIYCLGIGGSNLQDINKLEEEITKVDKEIQETDYEEIPVGALFGGYPQTQSAYDQGFIDGMKHSKEFL